MADELTDGCRGIFDPADDRCLECPKAQRERCARLAARDLDLKLMNALPGAIR